MFLYINDKRNLSDLNILFFYFKSYSISVLSGSIILQAYFNVTFVLRNVNNPVT